MNHESEGMFEEIRSDMKLSVDAENKEKYEDLLRMFGGVKSFQLLVLNSNHLFSILDLLVKEMIAQKAEGKHTMLGFDIDITISRISEYINPIIEKRKLEGLYEEN